MAKKERKLDRHQLFSYAAFGLVMMLLTYLLIAHTPLRRSIPGYPSTETQLAALENYHKIDSLERVIDLWAFQVANIQRVVTGREALPIDSMRLARVETEVDAGQLAHFETSDSLLRAQVEQIDAEQLTRPAPERIEALKNVPFKRPLKGTLGEGFRPTGSHAYVEITAPSGTTFSAILDGTIVSAEWNEREGCTLWMQHDGDLTSIYRQAGKLTRSVGEQVKAGTTLGVVGETGELSNAHILLELRYKNQPVDPSLYIEF
jgi:murein DD-endopeptidase MepM/ murein hydrolase activator NlpD